MSEKREFLSKVVVRAAEPADRQPVFAFLQDVWEGGDYLPSVWDEWLADPDGRMLVATLDGQPIATGRIFDLGWGEYWLEGLRVAAGYRGKGIAGLVQEELLKIWEQSDGVSVGYLTHRDQHAVHSLARREHFHEIFRVQMVRWGLEEGAHEFSPCEDWAEAARLLEAWAREHDLDGRMELGWAYRKVRPQRLRGTQQLYRWKERAFASLDIDDWDEKRDAVLSAVCFDPQDLAAFFVDLGRLCSMLELDGGRWFAPIKMISMIEKKSSNIKVVDDLEMVCYLKYR